MSSRDTLHISDRNEKHNYLLISMRLIRMNRCSAANFSADRPFGPPTLGQLPANPCPSRPRQGSGVLARTRLLHARAARKADGSGKQLCFRPFSFAGSSVFATLTGDHLSSSNWKLPRLILCTSLHVELLSCAHRVLPCHGASQ